MLSILREDDVKRCIKLFIGVFHNAPWHYEWMTEDKAGRYIRDVMLTPGFLGFTYITDGTLAGFCLGCLNDYFTEPQYEIKEIVVSAAYQRKGIGTGMLQGIEAHLEQQGIGCVTLMTSRDIPAYEFYLKNHYADFERNVFLYKTIQKSGLL